MQISFARFRIQAFPTHKYKPLFRLHISTEAAGICRGSGRGGGGDARSLVKYKTSKPSTIQYHTVVKAHLIVFSLINTYLLGTSGNIAVRGITKHTAFPRAQ